LERDSGVGNTGGRGDAWRCFGSLWIECDRGCDRCASGRTRGAPAIYVAPDRGPGEHIHRQWASGWDEEGMECVGCDNAVSHGRLRIDGTRGSRPRRYPGKCPFAERTAGTAPRPGFGRCGFFARKPFERSSQQRDASDDKRDTDMEIRRGRRLERLQCRPVSFATAWDGSGIQAKFLLCRCESCDREAHTFATSAFDAAGWGRTVGKGVWSSDGCGWGRRTRYARNRCRDACVKWSASADREHECPATG